VRDRGSARTGRRPRKPERLGSMYPPSSANVSAQPLRAACANPVFGADEKRIRTKNTVMDKSKGGLGWLLYKIVDCARIRFSSVRNR
jgi:hypothetical protein